jgi:hypothetical protein
MGTKAVQFLILWIAGSDPLPPAWGIELPREPS